MTYPATAFAVKDTYKYLEGLGNYHSYVFKVVTLWSRVVCLSADRSDPKHFPAQMHVSTTARRSHRMD
jgi:hypothetical protein